MNEIKKSPLDSLGYHFIRDSYLPIGKDEYYFRNLQNQNGIKYRGLSAYEIEVLVRNRNTSDNWNLLLVSDAFNPELVQDCKFFGLVRIGKLEPYYLEFHNLRRPVGLYSSTIISADFGDNVCIDNVNYLSHYIVGNDAMIVNTNEVSSTDHAKFGNGILKEEEAEGIRIWLEVCNENGGRKIIPFDGMLPGDAWLWSRFRDDLKLQDKFKEFTDSQFDARRGYYGIIGDRTVVKNCRIIKDVLIGTDAYLKGANKLKNLTIRSSSKDKTQIGEGCELVNGIIGLGCRIFYGVKAVRFILASHSQLKYGARLINSYLGDNSTISCCEVLNSLIFPGHEQHHNNSFLCASLVQGQSNVAAGATIGSNHNSRSPDGELVAGRGFWPGLCVSLKHNSVFASFVVVAKGDYPHELNIPIPFSLVSNQSSKDELLVMPGFWFMHNMYALARNAWKYTDRDKRTQKIQFLEYDFLAPDTVSELIRSLEMMEKFVAVAYLFGQPSNHGPGIFSQTALRSKGKNLLAGPKITVDSLNIIAENFEHSRRSVKLLKVYQSYHIFRELIAYYVVSQLLPLLESASVKNIKQLQRVLPRQRKLSSWANVGGQLIEKTELQKLLNKIRSGRIKGWNQVHHFYELQGQNYPSAKLAHALAGYKQVFDQDVGKMDLLQFRKLLLSGIKTREWMTKGIFESRAKDYTNPYRQMVYETAAEMNAVIGSLDQNEFIKQAEDSAASFTRRVKSILRKIS